MLWFINTKSWQTTATDWVKNFKRATIQSLFGVWTGRNMNLSFKRHRIKVFLHFLHRYFKQIKSFGWREPQTWKCRFTSVSDDFLNLVSSQSLNKQLRWGLSKLTCGTQKIKSGEPREFDQTQTTRWSNFSPRQTQIEAKEQPASLQLVQPDALRFLKFAFRLDPKLTEV